MKLNECLDKYRSEIGEHCENLGKSSGPWGLGKKCYLSYKKGQRWEVVKLNVLQRFLRFTLLFYKETHINLVGRKIARLKIEADHDCLDLIVSKWSRKNLIFQGNSDIKRAKIIGLPENHLKPIYNAATARIIKKLYQPGDIILIEGWKAGNKITARKAGMHMTAFLPEDLIVRGWEPQNLEELIKVPNASKEKYKILLSYLDVLKTINIREYSDDEINSYESLKNEIIAKISELNLFYKSKNKWVLNAADYINAVFLDFKETKKPLKFLVGIMDVFIILEERHRKAFYQNISWEEKIEISNNMKARNDSLNAQITKYRNKGKRVFVCAGASHLLHFEKNDNCKEVRELLVKDAYCHVVYRAGYSRKTIVSKEESISLFNQVKI